MSFENIVEACIEKSKTSIPTEKGDYQKNGLWYCGKCNTPKQCEVTLFGEKKYPMCLCKCASDKLKAEDEERERIKRETQISLLRKDGFPEKDMQNWTFANDDMTNERITKAMQSYVDNFSELRKQGKGLLLHGSIGTGKTFAACEVANALIDKGYPVMVTNFSRIINTLQGTFEKQEYIDSFNRYALLVLDDLGIERDTAFAKEQVFNIVDNRYRAGLPMIITTNLTMDKLKNPDDIENSRIYDRILERCHPIEITGVSRRRKKVKESYYDMQKLLGL